MYILGIYSSLSDWFVIYMNRINILVKSLVKKFCISDLMNWPFYVINMYLASELLIFKFSLAQHSLNVCVVSENS